MIRRRRAGEDADVVTLRELRPAVRTLLETGELSPPGVDGRTDAFRLMKSTATQREQLEALWRKFRAPLVAEWRRTHDDGSLPWAATEFEEAADE